MNIELVDVMGTDASVSNSARVTHDKYKEKFDQSDVKLINYLAKHKHLSPFTHATLSLRCKAPIFLARQLGKHQVGLSWNEVSRRYVDDLPELYMPKVWRKKPNGSIKQGSGAEMTDEDWAYGLPSAIKDFYSKALWLYQDMLDSDVAPEMARMILPQSMMTRWIWSGSLLAFYRVYGLRIDSHAQLEAQEFAKELEKVIEPLFPNSWAALKEHV